MTSSKLAGLVVVACMTSACVSIPETSASDIAAAPSAFDMADTGKIDPAIDDRTWLAAFGSDALAAIVDEAAARNLDIEAGLASVRASEASLKAALSVLFPTVSAGASASADSGDDFQTVGRSARLSAAYELDLFGQNRLALASTREGLASQRYTQRALALSVRSSAASAYISLLLLRDQLATARANQDISQRIMDLVQVRYDAGAVSGFDLESQRASLAASRARIPQIELQVASAESALAILLGKPAQGFSAPTEDLDRLVAPSIQLGTPSDLLLRRPDLLAAEAQLRGANADIAAARAAYFPSIDLSAGVSSLLTSGVDTVTSVATSLSAPIFSGRRLAAQTEGAMAQRDVLVARYRQAAYNAFQDVDVALRYAQTAQMRETEYVQAEAASARALQLAQIRYSSGADDLNSLLSAQSSHLSAQDNLMQARADRLLAAIDLYAALGGGW